jgi:hypothetical protein
MGLVFGRGQKHHSAMVRRHASAVVFGPRHILLHHTSPYFTLSCHTLPQLILPLLAIPYLEIPHLTTPTPPGHEGLEVRPDHASRWLWLVRLCFDRRSSVRTLSIRILAVVLKNTHALPSLMDREERRYDEHTEKLGEISHAVAALSYLAKLYLT